MSKLIFPLFILAALSGLTGYWVYQQPSTTVPRTKAQPNSSQAEQQAEVEAILAGKTVSDRLGHPPLRQAFSEGAYQLVISAEDQWDTPLATGELYRGGEQLWQKALPHQYGPRYVIVSSAGQVLLIDEFINVASPHALTLIGEKGEVVAQHGFQDIQETLDLLPAQLTEKAASGWWVSAPPRLNSTGDKALISTGGTTLEVDLTSGAISRIVDL